jgi:hypothetical protein
MYDLGRDVALPRKSDPRGWETLRQKTVEKYREMI